MRHIKYLTIRECLCLKQAHLITLHKGRAIKSEIISMNQNQISFPLLPLIFNFYNKLNLQRAKNNDSHFYPFYPINAHTIK